MEGFEIVYIEPGNEQEAEPGWYIVDVSPGLFEALTGDMYGPYESHQSALEDLQQALRGG